MKRKNRNGKIQLVLLVLLICISVGYAIIRSGLNINGITNVSKSSWDVHFENLQATSNSNITPISVSNPTAQNKLTTVSYTVNFDNLGDVYEFTIEVVNGGSIVAEIDSIVSTVSIGGEDPITIEDESDLPDYIGYSFTNEDGSVVEEGYELDTMEHKTYKVRLEYKSDIDFLPDPDEVSEPMEFETTINASQVRTDAIRLGPTLSTDDNVSTILAKVATSSGNHAGYTRQGFYVPRNEFSYEPIVAFKKATQSQYEAVKATLTNNNRISLGFRARTIEISSPGTGESIVECDDQFTRQNCVPYELGPALVPVTADQTRSKPVYVWLDEDEDIIYYYAPDGLIKFNDMTNPTLDFLDTGGIGCVGNLNGDMGWNGNACKLVDTVELDLIDLSGFDLTGIDGEELCWTVFKHYQEPNSCV